MEAGAAVAEPRPAFRKPSHDTSQRNYRRRSPSTSSRSTSSSPSPVRAPGGWKRDRSISPPSPRKDGARVNSVSAKKGKTSKKDDGSDEEREYGPGTSEHVARSASYEQQGKANLHDSRRSSGAHGDRNHQGQALQLSRDSYGGSRRDGDYDHTARNRRSSDRGYGDRDGRTRDTEGEDERAIRGKAGGRDPYVEMEREGCLERAKSRDRDRDRGRERERSRSSMGGRDSYIDKGLDVERRNEGGRGRESGRDRDKDRYREREDGRNKSKYSEKDMDTREKLREKPREKERARDRYQVKSGVRDLGSPEDLDDGTKDWGRDRLRDREREKLRDKPLGGERNLDKVPDHERDGFGPRMRDSGNDGDKMRMEERKWLDSSVADTDRIKDVGRARERGKTRDSQIEGIPDDIKSHGRRKDPERYAEEDFKERDFRDKEDSREAGRPRDRNEQKERSRHRDRDGHRELHKAKDEFRDRDSHRELLKAKDDFRDRFGLSRGNEEEAVDPRDPFDSQRHQDMERTVGKVLPKDDVGSPDGVTKSNSRQERETVGSKAVSAVELGTQRDRDRRGRSSQEKAQGSEHDNDNAKDRSDPEMNDDGRTGKEKQVTTKRGDKDGSFKVTPKDGESKKERILTKGDSERDTKSKNLPALANDRDRKPSGTPDNKASKGSKWGPGPSDSSVQGAASEGVANDLTAAKMAALKAAELVNKNLGVSGFMSADQKKRLLWGSKKSSAEQEPVVAAGTNRWDTVHFSDPDRQEKFHKLMGVKADSSTDGKKEGETEVSLFTEEKQRELQQDLEKQFAAGLRRRDGRTVGLGL